MGLDFIRKNRVMGSGNHEVVDVSSDEEEEVDTRVDEDFDWLNDLSSDSTDVVEVLSEMKGSVDSLYRKPKALEDDDDDCVILDGDPDKTTKTDTDDKLAKDDDDDDDEVLVVGQKGEVLNSNPTSISCFSFVLKDRVLLTILYRLVLAVTIVSMVLCENLCSFSVNLFGIQ